MVRQRNWYGQKREMAWFNRVTQRSPLTPDPSPMTKSGSGRGEKTQVCWGYATGVKVWAVVGNHWVSRRIEGYITEQWNIAGQAHYSVMGADGVWELVSESAIRGALSLAVVG